MILDLINGMERIGNKDSIEILDYEVMLCKKLAVKEIEKKLGIPNIKIIKG